MFSLTPLKLNNSNNGISTTCNSDNSIETLPKSFLARSPTEMKKSIHFKEKGYSPKYSTPKSSLNSMKTPSKMSEVLKMSPQDQKSVQVKTFMIRSTQSRAKLTERTNNAEKCAQMNRARVSKRKRAYTGVALTFSPIVQKSDDVNMGSRFAQFCMKAERDIEKHLLSSIPEMKSSAASSDDSKLQGMKVKKIQFKNKSIKIVPFEKNSQKNFEKNAKCGELKINLKNTKSFPLTDCVSTNDESACDLSLVENELYYNFNQPSQINYEEVNNISLSGNHLHPQSSKEKKDLSAKKTISSRASLSKIEVQTSWDESTTDLLMFFD